MYEVCIPASGAYECEGGFVLHRDQDEPGEDKEYASVTLRDFERVDTLGMGGFGRVELVSACTWTYIRTLVCMCS